MRRKMKTAFLVGALLTGFAGQAVAQDTELDQMRSEMAQMRAEMAQMRAQQRADWMDQARRAEVEGMIRDVLSDANSRASLLQEGVMAGIDEKGKIFLMSGDGRFTANFYGQIQFRYIWNSLETDNTSGTRASESLSGFQVRRTKFGIKGEVGDGWGYNLKLSAARAIGSSGTDSGGDTDAGPANGLGAGDVYVQEAYITYDLGDGWSVLAGVTKLPFARQELVSAGRQVGVDRTLVNEFFTLNFSDQVQVAYETDQVHYAVAISDGGNASYSGFAADASNDFAVTGRVDWMAMGDDWGLAKDEFGADADALFLGGAVHYEVAEGGTGTPEEGVAWTVDALYKTGNVGLTAALFGNHTNNNGAVDSDQYGVYVQGDIGLADGWDVFGRWEWIDDDSVAGAGTGELQAVTFGVNRHFNKNVKLTADVVWIYDGDNPTADGNFANGGELSSGLGLTSTGFTAADAHDDQIALRLQLQLLF